MLKLMFNHRFCVGWRRVSCDLHPAWLLQFCHQTARVLLPGFLRFRLLCPQLPVLVLVASTVVCLPPSSFTFLVSASLASQKFIPLIATMAYYSLCSYSWFAINLSGCTRQCQPPTPAGSDNWTNNIFFCVIPPTWPPWRQMQTTNCHVTSSSSPGNLANFPSNQHFFIFNSLFWPVLHPMPHLICLGTTQGQNAIVRQRFMLKIPFARRSNKLISRQRPRPSLSCRPASVFTTFTFAFTTASNSASHSWLL